jgi:hypothetical protein
MRFPLASDRAFSRRSFFSASAGLGGLLALVPGVASAAASSLPDSGRERWLNWLEKVSAPVLEAASRHSLRKSMPIECAPGREADRAVCSPLEALSRLLAGLAPWLELEPSAGESARESALRTHYRSWAQQVLAAAVDPASSDYMRFGEAGQTLVDSAILTLALLRAPRQLFGAMDAVTRQRLIAALEKERKIQPPLSNWLLFSALNEVLLRKLDAPWERARIDHALHSLDRWYVGDGSYGDGPQYHADYYNSYIMHPFLLAILDEVGDDPAWKPMRASVEERALRYAAIQERSIASNGEFPLIGRSLTYRAGAFHLLAAMALRQQLPAAVLPAAVRGALTAVQERTLDAPGSFDARGWLRIGVAGHQPELGEPYISTGSLYLCSAAWLPLGLASSAPFWSDAEADWTQKKIWSGRTAAIDHAL